MKKPLSQAEIEKRFAEINALPPEELTPDEAESLAEAQRMDDGTEITLDAYKAERDYSGKLSLRIPKELHRELAEGAAQNGISLNQYALYGLTRLVCSHGTKIS